MSTLLDTNVHSELRKPRPSDSVLRFYAGHRSAETMINVISIGEIAYAVAKMPEGKRREELANWPRTRNGAR